MQKKPARIQSPLPVGWLVQCELERIADTALNAGIVIHIACNALQPRIQGKMITDGRVNTRVEDIH